MQSNTNLLKTLSVVQRKFSESVSTDLSDWLTIIADEFKLSFVDISELDAQDGFIQTAIAGQNRDIHLNDQAISSIESLRRRVVQSNAAEIVEIDSTNGGSPSFGCFPISLSGCPGCLGVMSSVQIPDDLQTALTIAAGQLATCFNLIQNTKNLNTSNGDGEGIDLRELTARLTDRVESERRRLSRELHDQAGQSLTAILIRLDLVSEKITDPTIRQQLQQIESLAEDTINEIRRISRDLRPAVLDDLGLEEALEGLTSTLSGGSLSINLIIEKPFPRMPEGIETALYRIAQEALNNVIKHAGATVVAVRLQHFEDEVQLEIKDNGCGIDLENKSNADHGIGMLGMKERADSHGGKLLVESQSGSGTRVKVEIPL